MSSAFSKLITKHCEPRRPIPTGVEPHLQPLPNVGAVLFDVYGTLLISASGDIGTEQADVRSTAMQELCHSFQLNTPAQRVMESFDAAILKSHQASREAGVAHPEVDIISIWEAALASNEGLESDDIRELALEFELRTNPVWPMPSADTILPTLRDTVRHIGIVSNAQFYTPLLIEALLDSPDRLGINPDLSFYSYRFGQAKPGLFLYEQAREALGSLGMHPEEALMVGNDMLNDIAAAHRVGFRTALFAGDKRSLRVRSDDDRVADIQPDLVITDLQQLAECLERSE